MKRLELLTTPWHRLTLLVTLWLVIEVVVDPLRERMAANIWRGLLTGVMMWAGFEYVVPPLIRWLGEWIEKRRAGAPGS